MKTPKPVRLEINNSGSWKLLATFDLAQQDTADRIIEATTMLANAIADPGCGGSNVRTTWRISTQESLPVVLATLHGAETFWRDHEGHLTNIGRTIV